MPLNNVLDQGNCPKQPMHGGNVLWAAQLANCSPSDILDVSASISPLGPPASAIAAIQDNLNRLIHYPDPSYRLLRGALGDFHDVDPEWIIPGNGAAEILTWIGRDLADCRGDGRHQSHLIAPAFGDYERALTAFDADIVSHSLNLDALYGAAKDGRSHVNNLISDGSVDLVAVLNEPLSTLASSTEVSSNTSDFSRAMPIQPVLGASHSLLVNNPHNPTGALFSAASIESFCEEMARVVVDEAFMDFLRPHQQQSLIQRVSAFSNLIIVRSLTKFYSLPGLRIGYAIAHPDHIKRWQQWRDPWPVNTLAESAAIAILQDSDFQQQTWQWLEEARVQLFQGLLETPGLQPFPGAANFLLIRANVSVIALQRWLLEHHRILIRDCMSFPELGDRYFRIAVRTTEENDRVLHAISSGMHALMA